MTRLTLSHRAPRLIAAALVLAASAAPALATRPAPPSLSGEAGVTQAGLQVSGVAATWVLPGEKPDPASLREDRQEGRDGSSALPKDEGLAPAAAPRLERGNGPAILEPAIEAEL